MGRTCLRGLRVYGAVLAVALALRGPSLVAAVDPVDRVEVKPGDTLLAISRAYGVSVEQLVALNQLADPDRIVAGQVLRLAGVSNETAQAPAAAREIVVEPGDTLWSLARRYGISAEELARANHLEDPDRLAVGQRLALPEPPAAAVESTASTTPQAVLPPADSPVGQLLAAAAEREQIDPALAQALAWHLSRWNPEAGGEGTARGVMLLTPSTEEWVRATLLRGERSGDAVRDNIDAGLAYLGFLLKRFGDPQRALAAYIQGPASVRERGVAESTQDRVQAVLALADQLRAGGRLAEPPAGQGEQASPTPQPTEAAAAAEGDATEDAGQSASPDPTRPGSAVQLQQTLEAVIDAQPEGVEVGLVAANLTTGQRISINAEQVFPSASVLKLGILLAVYQEVANGDLELREDVERDLERMITLSDNEAANRLMDLVGIDRINNYLAGYSLTRTHLYNHFSAGEQPTRERFNQTTAQDMARLLELLAQGRVVNTAASLEMRKLLARTEDSTKIVRPLPTEVRVEHKSGWFNGVANDVGIVYAPRADYVLAVLSRGAPSTEKGNQLIADISRLVYAAWGAE